jgi:hypothetical protein
MQMPAVAAESATLPSWQVRYSNATGYNESAASLSMVSPSLLFECAPPPPPLVGTEILYYRLWEPTLLWTLLEGRAVSVALPHTHTPGVSQFALGQVTALVFGMVVDPRPVLGPAAAVHIHLLPMLVLMCATSPAPLGPVTLQPLSSPSPHSHKLPLHTHDRRSP